jgi:hypothetical protein
MTDPKDNESFFRKVVRFVANPATDWHELNTRVPDMQEAELEKSELKAMIERKRRNDFVRRREFDMLRKVRREGLTPEQLAALGGSSRLDEAESRLPEGGARHTGGVKAKIDAIEQQMVGDTYSGTSTRRGGGFGHSTASGRLAGADDRLPDSGDDMEDDESLPALPPLPDPDAAPADSPASGAPVVMISGLSPLAPLTPDADARRPGTTGRGGAPVEVSEGGYDATLDEAVIAFANADFEECEQALTRLISPTGARADHADTWLVLFDLFRAIGQQQRFESLAVEYAHQFGSSAPQWYSLPKLVAEAVSDDLPRAGRNLPVGDVGWTAPELLDTDALSQLRSQTLQMPLPWVFDWRALRSVDAEAATQLSVLCRMWAGQTLEMRWIGGDHLFNVLQDASPTGVRDADPAFWLARLDALRLTNRVDQFDETAIDYCVTYEVSPPSWEPARCSVRIGGPGPSTRNPPMSIMSEVSTSVFESGMHDDIGVELASVELSGQLLGDINETLNRLTSQLGKAPMVSVSCARLIRVDFLAAGDLLNWVISRRDERRTIQFVDAHRLVALFLGAMGISEHAQVQVRKV